MQVSAEAVPIITPVVAPEATSSLDVETSDRAIKRPDDLRGSVVLGHRVGADRSGAGSAYASGKPDEDQGFCAGERLGF
jgi:hypothetical protein